MEMLEIEKENQSSIREFILLGFGNLPEMQSFLFWFFLVIYLMTIFGNFLIFLLVVADQHLHTPMYFFLSNLSCLDTCYSFNFLPKMTGKRTISVNGCLAQYHFFCICASIETYLLAAMSYNSYLAICRPLEYASIMNNRFCFQLMVAIGINSLIFNVILLTVVVQLTFCGPNIIDHYFCDLYSLMKLSCSDTSLFECFTFCMTTVFTIPPFLLTLTSYICIIITIINIKSTKGRHKAFSTCSSHLVVVCLFYGTLFIAYSLSDTPTLRYLDKIISIFYTVMTPLVNPLIYTLRNKEVHKTLRRHLDKMMIFYHLSLDTGICFSILWQSNFNKNMTISRQ